MRTADDMWLQAIRNCLDGQLVDSRIEESKEVIGWCHKLDTLDYTFLMNRRRKASMVYAMAELLWYLAGTRTIEMIGAYAPQYAKFTNDGIAWGAYGWRWKNDTSYVNELGRHNYSQLFTLVDLLRKSPNDRRGVVTMWNASDLVHAERDPKNDIPCTLSWQFVLRNGVLHMVCTMRSEDVWLGMPYDVFVNTCVQRLVADCLGVKTGTYTHQVGSLHVYKGAFQKVHEALDVPQSMQFAHEWELFNLTDYRDLDRQTKTALDLERMARLHKHIFYDTMMSLHPVLHDAVLLCTSKWCPVTIGKIQSRALRTEHERRQHETSPPNRVWP